MTSSISQELARIKDTASSRVKDRFSRNTCFCSLRIDRYQRNSLRISFTYRCNSLEYSIACTAVWISANGNLARMTFHTTLIFKCTLTLLPPIIFCSTEKKKKNATICYLVMDRGEREVAQAGAGEYLNLDVANVAGQRRRPGNLEVDSLGVGTGNGMSH